MVSFGGKIIFPILCCTFSIYSFFLNDRNPSYLRNLKMLNWKCSCYYNGMAVSGELAQVRSAHDCTLHSKCFVTSFKRDCIDLHHNYILQAFVLQMVICKKKLFLINLFHRFLRQRLHLKQDCCSDFAGLALIFDRRSLLSQDSAHLPSLVLGE